MPGATPDNPSRLFQGDKDLNYIKARDKERYYLFQTPCVVRFHLPSTNPKVNNTYGEVFPGKLLFAPPVTMPVHVHPDPDKNLLTKMGYDEPQDCLLVFSIAVLENLGIDWKDITKGPKIGDRVDFPIRNDQDLQYEIRNVNDRHLDFWGNTNALLHIVCTGSRMTERKAA